MKTRIIAALILLPFFLAVLLIFPPTVLAVTIFIISALILFEFYRAFRKAEDVFGSKKRSWFVILVTVVVLVGLAIPIALFCLYLLRTMPNGRFLVLLPIIVTFLTDSGAYFVGVGIGKRKAFPTISPNKTVEGCVGGLVIGTLGIAIYGIILNNFTELTVFVPLLALCGFVASVATEFGDLFFSKIKRVLEIKDYGNLIPGHGGMLDRFDSMIFSAPTMYLLIIALPVFT